MSFVLPAIALGVSALSNIFGAKKQASAAKDAAAFQQAATQQAMRMMHQAYAPYLQAGSGAVNVLNRLMTPGVPYTPEMQAQDAMAPSPWAMPMGGPGQAVPRSVMGSVLTMPGDARRPRAVRY